MHYLQTLRGRLATASLATVLVAGSLAHQAHADQTTYQVQPNDTLSSIAVRYGTTVSALMSANDLSSADYVQAGQVLVIAAAVQASSTVASTSYLVQWGDTLTAIDQRFGVTTQAVADLNGLSSPYLIRAGERLMIPAGQNGLLSGTGPATDVSTVAGSVPVSTGTPAAPVSGGILYTVQPGDTLSSVSSQFGASIDAVASANNIDSNAYLIAGQQLAIPAADSNPNTAPGTATATATPAAASVQTNDYVVQPGDTLSTIGWRFGTSADALASTNNITTGSIIDIGQTLLVPGGLEPFVTRAEVGNIITSEAEAAGIDPSLVKAIAWQESGWQMVTASDGGIGVMQLMPDSVDWVSTSLLGYRINPYDTTENIRGGIAMLRYYLSVYPDVQHAIAAYHQGMASVDNIGFTADTQSYIANVLALQQQFAG